MLVQLLDAQDIPHWVAWQGLDQVNDFSGTLGAGNVGAGAVFLQVMPAQTTEIRCGLLFQNTSANAMLLNELSQNGAGEVEIVNSWVVNSGGFFPPPGVPFPVITGALMVIGSSQSATGDTFACREFVNAPGE